MSLLSRQPFSFAQIIPPEPGNLVITLSLVAFLVSMAAACVSIWYMTRRQPTSEQYIDRELTRLETRMDTRFTITANDLDALKLEIKSNNASTQKSMSILSKSLEISMQDIQRAVGRIEGILQK